MGPVSGAREQPGPTPPELQDMSLVFTNSNGESRLPGARWKGTQEKRGEREEEVLATRPHGPRLAGRVGVGEQW